MATFAKHDFSYAAYASFRPSYPPALYDMILTYHRGQRDTCLDLGCGHGIVSNALAPIFKKIYGVDPSAGMIEQARELTTEQKNIQFVQSKAESLPFIQDHSIDLVVAGEAAHWFSYPQLFAELKRVMKPGGTLAFWGYANHVYVDHPKATAIMAEVYDKNKDFLGPYWAQPAREILRDKLRAIQPPLEDWTDIKRIEYEPGLDGAGSGVGTKFLEMSITLGQSMEYIRTWSAYHGWKEAHPGRIRRAEGGEGDIVDEIFDKMVEAEKEWTGMDHQTAAEKIVHIEWSSGLILARKSKVQ